MMEATANPEHSASPAATPRSGLAPVLAAFFFLLFLIAPLYPAQARLIKINTFADNIADSDLLVAGETVSVATGDEIAPGERGNTVGMYLVESLVDFKVGCVIKGATPASERITVVMPRIDIRKHDGCINCPIFTQVGEGEKCILALKTNDDAGTWRLASQTLVTDNPGTMQPLPKQFDFAELRGLDAADAIAAGYVANFRLGDRRQILKTLGCFSPSFGRTTPMKQRLRTGLRALCETAPPETRNLAAVALCACGDIFGATGALAEIREGGAVIPAMNNIRSLARQTHDPWLCSQFIELLSSPNWRVREGAVIGLANNYDSAESLDAIVKAAGDAQFNVQHSVASTLRRIGPKMSDEQRNRLRANALQVLQTGNTDAQQGAATVLAELGDSSVAPVLIEHLNAEAEIPGGTTSRRFARSACIRTIATLADDKSVPVLVNELRHPAAWSARTACVSNLRRLTKREFGFDLTNRATEEEQSAAVKRWLAWWDSEGKTLYP